MTEVGIRCRISAVSHPRRFPVDLPAIVSQEHGLAEWLQLLLHNRFSAAQQSSHSDILFSIEHTSYRQDIIRTHIAIMAAGDDARPGISTKSGRRSWIDMVARTRACTL
jgi:hypothetical protein